MKELFTVCVIAFLTLGIFNVNAQDQWEPRFYGTGYIVTEFEYANVDTFETRDQTALGLSEAAYCATYLPLQKLEIKGTFLYRNGVESVDKAIVEAYSNYSFNNALKVGLGRYLTPLSPTNHYFYAPLNNSATLPLLINHYMLFPQSFDGVKVSGEFGSKIKYGYTGIVGQYLSLGHNTTDLLDFQGSEEFIVTTGDVLEEEISNPLGLAIRLNMNVNEVFKIGGNYFFGNSTTADPKKGSDEVDYVDSKRNTFGADMSFVLNNFNIKGEYWYGEKHTNKGEVDDEASYSDGYYAEASYQYKNVTPYIKYDYVHDVDNVNTIKYTAGLAYRPLFQTLFKVEYGKYNFDISDEMISTNGEVQDDIDLFIVSAVVSF
jgi:hypothetical protein